MPMMIQLVNTETALKRLRSPESPSGVQALADMLGVSRTTVWRWRTEGYLSEAASLKYRQVLRTGRRR